MKHVSTPAADSPPRGRLALGGVIVVSGFLCPLLVPLVAASDLPAAWKAGLSGLLLIGLPELFMLVAVAVLGKAGFQYLKTLVLGFVKRHALPPERVGPTRHRVGIVLFVTPILLGWLGPYLHRVIPAFDERQIWLQVGGDLLLVASLFVLGGEFWDKLRALFLREARVQLPGASEP